MSDSSPQSATQDMIDQGAIGAYLDLIYPPGWDWRGEIGAAHSLPGGTGMPSAHWPRERAVYEAVEFARSAQRRDAPGVYLRCSTVRPDIEPGRRGGAQDSVELPGLWADLDIAGPGHRHDPGKHGGLVLPPDAAGALAIVTASGLPAPSAVVHSGGGLYAWWLFDRRVELAQEGHAVWSRISEAWQARLAEGASSIGLHYGTGVGNLDRVLGLVGTPNRKVPGLPTPRRLLHADGPRYAPEVLAEASGHATAPGPVQAGSGAVATGQWQVVPHGSQLPSEPLVASRVRPAGHVSPLDDLETRHTWAQILTPLGWELVKGVEGQGECHWRRPGASHPLSATTGREADRDRMWVFSDAAGLPVNEPLTKGFVFAALYHGGDMRAAAGAVKAMGYGSTTHGEGDGVGGQDATTNPGRRLELTAASGMGGPRATRWLWAEGSAEWLPLGGLCLLGGREGRGKSTWVVRLIAELTRGTLAGDLHGTPHSAVIAATEDDWRATIIPRLMAAGADLDRVYRIDAVEPDRVTGVSLPEDLWPLRALLAERTDVALLVLDPIMSVIPARADSHKDHEVRRSLEPISALAHAHGVTVLGLIHDNKSTGTDLSTRLMGSRAFVAVARAALVCTEEQDTPDEGSVDARGADPVRPSTDASPLPAGEVERPRVFLLGQIKSNLGPKVGVSIRYVIGAEVVAHDEELDKDVRGSYVHRIGRRTAGVEEIVREAERVRPSGDGAVTLRSAQERILALLDGGERGSRSVKDALIDGGFTLSTIERAAREMVRDGRIRIVRNGRETSWSPTTPPEGEGGNDGLKAMKDEGGRFAEASSFVEADCLQPSPSPTPRARAREVKAIDSGCACPEGQHWPWCAGAA